MSLYMQFYLHSQLYKITLYGCCLLFHEIRSYTQNNGYGFRSLFHKIAVIHKITGMDFVLLFHKIAVIHKITGMDFVLLGLQTYLEFSVGSFGSVVKVESVVKEVFVYLRSKSQNRGLVTRSPVNCSPKVKPCYTKLNL
jgi:hypothetical protein